ncbi:hypothetical protein AG1IA_04912 [Rhizoctonia solani AG-1 IA]|uniref:Uncharacterized protein n=1 Tax=Thanatephorus cucumeris (strain AG1-IA) TaxID=983506 RepID=L8WW93_THACA|nr:hypothetical protein AG1IA_04912 [Rhizoctonia solani AG-1 IA]
MDLVNVVLSLEWKTILIFLASDSINGYCINVWGSIVVVSISSVKQLDASQCEGRGDRFVERALNFSTCAHMFDKPCV